MATFPGQAASPGAGAGDDARPGMSDANAPAAVWASDAPDWAQIRDDPCCARCGYILRGLQEPRCPECGLAFVWAQVLDPARRSSDFLFEHHWRGRFFRAYFATLWRSLRPGRFWRAALLFENVRRAPLAAYALTAPLWFMLVLHGLGLAVWQGAELYERVRLQAPPSAGPPGYVLSRLGLDWVFYCQAVARLPFDWGWRYGAFLAFVFGAYVLAGALLLSLRRTLANGGVRGVQVFRIAAYSAPPVAIAWGLCWFAAVVGESRHEWSHYLLFSAAPLVHAAWLAAGLGAYLRLPHAWLTALVAAGTGALASWTALAAWQVWTT